MGGSSTTTTNNQATESEKRRKQTVERAKANHLSRQLQMRLQYARLKVDHGWQKQNLNEVENLYFRHSHQRGLKPYPTPLIATTQRDPPFPPSNSNGANQSSLSFKLGPSNLSRSHTGAEAVSGNDEQLPGSGLGASTSSSSLTSYPSPPVVSSPSVPVHAGNPANSSEGSSLISMDVEEQKRSPTPSSFPQIRTPPIITSSPSDFPTARSHSLTNIHSPHMSSSPVPTWSTGTGPIALSKHYSNLTQRQSQSHSLPSPPADTYGFGASNLTYDSFWSAHSTSAVTRPFRNSTGNILADVSGSASPQVGQTVVDKEDDNNRHNALVTRIAKDSGRQKSTGGRLAAGRES